MKILYLPNCYSQQRQREKKANIYPIRLAMEATYYAKQGHEVHWGKAQGKYDKIICEPESLPFLSLPHADRILTKWWEYQNNGNFKYHPGTYILSASGCHWGKCEFCVEKKEKYEVRDVCDVINEIHMCFAHEGFREVFDDSATFPIGNWLTDFCNRMVEYQRARQKVVLGCNMRMVDVDYKLMKQAGFRMLLFGLESANQNTLYEINKGVKVEDYKYIIKAAQAGLDPHIAVMFGYPWETEKDALRTLKLVHYLLRKGYAKTAQASFFNCSEYNSQEAHRKYINKIYDVKYSPEFWFRKLVSIRNKDDIKYLWKQIKAGLNDYQFRRG